MFHKHKEMFSYTFSWNHCGEKGEKEIGHTNAGWRGERVYREKNEKETWESTKAQLVIYTGEFWE